MSLELASWAEKEKDMKRELDRTEGTTERKNDTEKFSKSKQIAQTGHKRKKKYIADEQKRSRIKKTETKR